jgi:hypothetical protein
MTRTIKIKFEIDTAPLVRQLRLLEATLARDRINGLLRSGHGRLAESIRKAYYFKHGTTPAEHAFALRKEIALASDRWSPQP